MRGFGQRVAGALRVDPGLYEEVEADRSATAQAMGVVVMASLASGLGLHASDGLLAIVAGVFGALIGWGLWAGLTYFIGTRLLGTPATSSTWGEILRTTGFAAAPGIFRIFGFVPLVGMLVYLVVSVWMLVTFVVAVRQALDYTSTWRAVAVCATGWLVNVFVGALLVPLAN
jgi:hypothetical protein